MKKVIVYIDGFNLYYGMLKGTPYKWLDLEKFVDELVSDDVEVVAIKYFTAQIKTYPFDLQKVQRQQFYIRAVSMLPRVKVIEGFYTKHKIRMPFYKEPCISCDKTDGMASVVKLEEKRSDVNIATEMLLDAMSGAADAFMLISGDSDLAGPVAAIRYRVKRPVAVFNPHEGECHELRRFSTFCKNGKMPEALDFYRTGDNSLKIVTALYHSTLRFTFDTEVLWPIMVTCSEDDPREEFLDVLLMEKALQDMSLVGGADDVYVPETYSDLLIQTGHLLSAIGRLDDALHMSEDMQKAATLATGSPLVGMVTAARYRATVMCVAGKQDDAIASLQDTMNSLIASTPKKNAEEYEEMIDLLRQEINGIRELLED